MAALSDRIAAASLTPKRLNEISPFYMFIKGHKTKLVPIPQLMEE